MRNRRTCRLFLEQLEPRVALSSFIISGYPSAVTAGTANNFSVTVEDAFGNTVSDYTGTVTFSTSAVKAVLPANYRFTLSDAGTHTFSAILRSAGTQSLTAKDILDSSITGSESGIVVNPAATNHLTVSRFPSPTTAGVSQSFRVTAQDMFGNTTPSFADTVSFRSTDSQAVVSANYTFTSADLGVHTFSTTLKTAGSQSITAQDATNASVAPGSQISITVNPAAADRLQISGFPSSVIAGTANNFTVSAVDPYSRRRLSRNSELRYHRSSGGAAGELFLYQQRRRRALLFRHAEHPGHAVDHGHGHGQCRHHGVRIGYCRGQRAADCRHHRSAR
jgi:hypothetical protein